VPGFVVGLTATFGVQSAVAGRETEGAETCPKEGSIPRRRVVIEASVASAFWYKLALSFLVGGVWVAVTTVAAERFGSKIGGLIGGLPTTAVITLLFIGVTQTCAVATEATTVMPLAQGLNGLFLIAFVILARRGLAVSLTGALFVWLLIASVLVSVGIQRFWVSIAAWVLLVVACYWVVEKRMQIPSRGRVDLRYTLSQIAGRAGFGGAVIAFAVLMGKLGGPVHGGVFATFPAMFLSTLVITHRAGGAEFSRATAKALLVSGLVNVALYAIVVRYLYASAGLAYGTMLALLFSCCTGYLTYLFMRARLT